MASVVANLVVNFSLGEGDGGVLQLELDSRDDGYNNGSTTFTPGQKVYYLLTKTPDVNIIDHLSTAGIITYVTSEVIEEEEIVTYAGASSANTQYPIHGAYATKWLGRPGASNVVLTSPNTLSLKDSAGDDAEGLGVLHVTYTHVVDVYLLSGLPSSLNGEEEYTVIVYVTGES